MIVVSAQAFPPASGGIQNLLAGTAEHLARAGHGVLVLADGGRAERRFDVTPPRPPYAVRRFSGPRPLRRWLKARALKKLARTARIEALYLDSWKSLEPLPAGLPFPVVPWAHGNEFPPSGPKVARIRRALGKATHILVNSADTLRRIGEAMPEGVPYTIVHPPVFPAVEPTPEDAARAAAIWGSASPRLVSVCRLIDWKGIDQAIRAMPAILAHLPGARLAVAGEGGDRARLEAIAGELGLAAHVHFLGRIGDGLRTALYRSADLFLQPGRQVVEEREGYGISYVEAALEGLPAISGMAGGAPEAIRDGETGLVVDGTSTEAVAEAALRILTDHDLHARMREAARAHGRANLWENRIGGVLAAAGL